MKSIVSMALFIIMSIGAMAQKPIVCGVPWNDDIDLFAETLKKQRTVEYTDRNENGYAGIMPFFLTEKEGLILIHEKENAKGKMDYCVFIKILTSNEISNEFMNAYFAMSFAYQWVDSNIKDIDAPIDAKEYLDKYNGMTIWMKDGMGYYLCFSAAKQKEDQYSIQVIITDRKYKWE